MIEKELMDILALSADQTADAQKFQNKRFPNWKIF